MNSECRPSHSSQYYLIMFIYIITVFSRAGILLDRSENGGIVEPFRAP